MTVLLSAFAAGCGTSAEPPGTPHRPLSSVVPVSSEHNDTDVAYAHELSALHQQAIDMVAMVATKDVSPPLHDLASKVGRDRSAEIRILHGMLEAWQIPRHAPDFHANPGEVTREQLRELYSLDGPAFEGRWLEMLADNHTGAVAMSRAELADGLNVGTRQLARELVQRQEAQIESMTELAHGG